MGIWTDEEIRTLVSMWPTNSVMKIATQLNCRRKTIYAKAKWLHKKGVLEDKDFPRSRPINPDLQDFDEVKRDYCRKHHITVAKSVQGLNATPSLRRSCIGWLERPRSQGCDQGS